MAGTRSQEDVSDSAALQFARSAYSVYGEPLAGVRWPDPGLIFLFPLGHFCRFAPLRLPPIKQDGGVSAAASAPGPAGGLGGRQRRPPDSAGRDAGDPACWTAPQPCVGAGQASTEGPDGLPPGGVNAASSSRLQASPFPKGEALVRLKAGRGQHIPSEREGKHDEKQHCGVGWILLSL